MKWLRSNSLISCIEFCQFRSTREQRKSGTLIYFNDLKHLPILPINQSIDRSIHFYGAVVIMPRNHYRRMFWWYPIGFPSGCSQEFCVSSFNMMESSCIFLVMTECWHQYNIYDFVLFFSSGFHCFCDVIPKSENIFTLMPSNNSALVFIIFSFASQKTQSSAVCNSEDFGL